MLHLSNQKGGSLSSILNRIVTSLPGGSDMMDVFWSQQNQGRNLWNNWNGHRSVMSPDPSVQPIGQNNTPYLIKQPNMEYILHWRL